MYYKLWNFLRGYVKINMSGFSVERLINQATAAGVIFSDLVRVGAIFSGRVSRGDFVRLMVIAERTGTKLAEVGRFGLPNLARRLRKRVLLLIGPLFFVAALVLLNSYIWRIDIEGARRINTAEMTEFLAQKGFAVGTWRHGVAYRDVEALLMAQFSDIAWVSLSITGTRATIRLVETIEMPVVVDPSTPTDIVAAKDGLIIHMATSRGVPQFRPGDVVRAGDVIVSGRLTIGVEGEPINYEYIRAASEVWARLYYRINFRVPLVFYEKSFTGRTHRVYSIMVGGRNFTLPHTNHDFIYYTVGTGSSQLSLGENFPLPLGFASETYHELESLLRRRSVEEAWRIGEEMVLSRISEELAEGTQIVTKEISYIEEENAIIIEVFLITIERIDQERAVLETRD